VSALLDAGTRGPVTIVSAGAGWGKTLATAAWAGGGPRVGPVAWVSLDSTDNQPRAFWSYAVGALRASGAVAPDNPLAHLVPGLANEDEILRRFVAGVSELPEPVVLVLDDYHLIDDPAVVSAVTALVRVPVPQLRLVLLTRADPMLPLHRLRLAGELGEIRSADLALTPADAATLLARDGVVLGPGDAELLVDRSEGWPAGLRLAALFLARGEPGRGPADFGGDDHAVVEYLVEGCWRATTRRHSSSCCGPRSPSG
jgi:LuxR family maltose regulon positive regulatory protein